MDIKLHFGIVTEELKELITSISYELLEQECGGWEINDGSSGIIKLKLDKQLLYTVKHRENRMIQRNFSFKGTYHLGQRV